jgi:hypothetical protein
LSLISCFESTIGEFSQRLDASDDDHRKTGKTDEPQRSNQQIGQPGSLVPAQREWL